MECLGAGGGGCGAGFPGFFVVIVAIGGADVFEDVFEGVFEVSVGDGGADGGVELVDLVAGFGREGACGDGVVGVFGDEGKGAVDEVAPAAQELGVVAFGEFAPGEVGVSFFGTVDEKEVADGVRVVSGGDFVCPDGPVVAGGDFAAFQGKVFAGDDGVG